MRWVFLFLVALQIHAKTVCLNMIVKNETKAIEHCLRSVKDQIDYWVIVDTGSTDGTQGLIQEVMKGVPGELYERPWVNFEVNRNEALALARGRGDYFLMIDADERLSFANGAGLPELDKDCYFITVRESGADYQRIFLIDGSLPWRWEGVLHETLICEQSRTFDLIDGGMLLSNTADGFRSQDEKKYLKDALVLEGALKEDPNNSRNVFYLAQSYFNAKEYLKAKEQYERRAEMGGWEEEVFWSIYRVAQIEQNVDRNLEKANELYRKAYQYRPTRAEPLYYLANNYIAVGDFVGGYSTAKFALTIPVSTDHVFVEHWIYQYGFWVTLAHAAFELKFYKEAKEICYRVSQMENVDASTKAAVESNYQLLTQMGIK